MTLAQQLECAREFAGMKVGASVRIELNDVQRFKAIAETLQKMKYLEEVSVEMRAEADQAIT